MKRYAALLLAFALAFIGDVRPHQLTLDTYAWEREALADMVGPIGSDLCGEVTGTSTLTVTSVQSAPATGGSIQITGTGFDAALGMTVLIGYPANAKVQATAVTSTSMAVQIPPLTAGAGTGTGTQLGFYNVTVVKKSCSWNNVGAALNVVTTVDPNTIFGSALRFWYKIDAGLLCTGAVTCSGNGTTNVATWADQTANHYDLACSATQCPLYYANSGAWSGSSGITADMLYDGVNDSLDAASVSYASTSHDVFAVYRSITNTATNQVIVSFNGTAEVLKWRNSATVSAFGATESINATPQAGANTINIGAMGGFDGAGTVTVTSRSNNITSATNTVAGTPSNAAQALHLGATASGSGTPGNFRLVELFGVNATPNSTQELQVAQYEQARWGLEAPLAFTGLPTYYPLGSTNVAGGASGRSLRFVLTGNNQTGSYSIVGLSAPTTTYGSALYADVTALPATVAGTSYTVIYSTTNNGQSITIPGGLIPKSSASFDFMTAIGTKAVGVYLPINSTCVSPPCAAAGSVAAVSDVSGMQAPLAQGTGANQFVYTPNDAACGGANPSWTGTSRSLVGSVGLDGTTTVLTLAAFNSSTSLSRNLSSYGANTSQLKQVTNTDLTFHTTAADVSFGASIASGPHEIYGYSLSASTIGVNKDFGTEVTSTTTTAVTSGQSLNVGQTSTGSIGAWCAFVVANNTLTSQEKTDAHAVITNTWTNFP